MGLMEQRAFRVLDSNSALWLSFKFGLIHKDVQLSVPKLALSAQAIQVTGALVFHRGLSVTIPASDIWLPVCLK